MGNVVPPRPRDPDAFLGRSGNVATVGVLPAIANLGVPPTVQTPATAAKALGLTFLSAVAEGLSSGSASLESRFTAPASGLWIIDWAGESVFESAGDWVLNLYIDGALKDFLGLPGWGGSSGENPVNTTTTAFLETGAYVTAEMTSNVAPDSRSLTGNAYGIPGIGPR